MRVLLANDKADDRLQAVLCKLSLKHAILLDLTRPLQTSREVSLEAMSEFGDLTLDWSIETLGSKCNSIWIHFNKT